MSGPFQRGPGGHYGFHRDQFFLNSQLQRIIFSDLIKSKQFDFSAVEHKTVLSPFISFDSPHTILTS